MDEFRLLLQCDKNKVLLNSPERLITALKSRRLNMIKILLDAGDPNVFGKDEYLKSCQDLVIDIGLSGNLAKPSPIAKRVIKLIANSYIIFSNGIDKTIDKKAWTLAKLLIDHGSSFSGAYSVLANHQDRHHNPSTFMQGIQKAPAPSSLASGDFKPLIHKWF